MTSTSDPLVGRLLDGRYQIIARLARGGMATVYRAVDTRLTRTVAVKVMHVGLGDDVEFARKFDREARAAAKLSHPGVVAVFDQGQDAIDGHTVRPYIVMEYVEGQTLRDVINDEAPMAAGRALELMESVLSALAAAHEAGLIHRDIKPENVLISDRGQLKVADFGLAKAISSQTSTATQGLLIGTVSYLPPELVLSGRADARSDVYSAGVVLFELLTGRKPHTGETPIQVAYAHVHSDVPAPSSFPTPAPLPPYVDALVARATARDPALRPPDARVLLMQLRRVRAALRAGLRDDPELTDDLSAALRTPAPPAAPADRSDYEVTELVAAPRPPAATAAPAPPALPPPLPSAAPSPAPSLAPSPAQQAAADRLAAQRARQLRQVRRRRRGWVAFLLVLVLTAVATLTGWYLLDGRYTSAPALAGLSRADAGQLVERAGLEVSFTEAYSESVAKGLVIDTDPGPGSRIRKGGHLDAVLSLGQERYPMPAVVGLSRDAATATLRQANLGVGKVARRYSETVAAGVVVKASAAPGDSLKKGTAIALSVSRGPQPVTIEDYTGKAAAAAEDALRTAGFTVTERTAHSTRVTAGKVLTQTPHSGSGRKGDPVIVTRSLGPALVMVPNVKGMGVRAAEQVMRDAGFRTKVKAVAVNYLGLGYVATTGPRARTQAPQGSTVTLYVV